MDAELTRQEVYVRPVTVVAAYLLDIMDLLERQVQQGMEHVQLVNTAQVQRAVVVM